MHTMWCCNINDIDIFICQHLFVCFKNMFYSIFVCKLFCFLWCTIGYSVNFMSHLLKCCCHLIRNCSTT